MSLDTAGTSARATWVVPGISPGWPGLIFFCSLPLPPLPLPIGNSGVNIAPLVALLGLLVGVVRAGEWQPSRHGNLSLLFALFVTVLTVSVAFAALYSGWEIALGSLARVLLFGIGVYIFFYTLLGTRVPDGGNLGNDELGRLARTFNAMCGSIQEAREELIRQERISTIGRLSSSIVHDLRNPLASIYGGAEMMMDGHLNEAQLHRVAGNIYRSLRAINDLLQELVDVSRGRTQAPELCRLNEVIAAASDTQASSAEQQGVRIDAAIDPSIELPLERARIERVFLNLIGNALEAMPNGGCVEIRAERKGDCVLIRVDDTGPGIPASVRKHLFQPFVSEGKNGLGLGLALSRQTLLDHGGDLWAEETESSGARFRLRLPCQPG